MKIYTKKLLVQNNMKHSIIFTGVVGLALPAARPIYYDLACFVLIWQFTTYYTNTLNGFITTNYQTINFPTLRENLDSTLKHSYPFVTQPYRLYVICNGASI